MGRVRTGDPYRATRSDYLRLSLCLVCGSLIGCTAVGPTTKDIERAPLTATTGLRVVPVTESVASDVNVADVHGDFAARIGDAMPIGTRVGIGDTLEVTIWEAAPAALFGTGTISIPLSVPRLQLAGRMFCRGSWSVHLVQ